MHQRHDMQLQVFNEMQKTVDVLKVRTDWLDFLIVIVSSERLFAS